MYLLLHRVLGVTPSETDVDSTISSVGKFSPKIVEIRDGLDCLYKQKVKFYKTDAFL